FPDFIQKLPEAETSLRGVTLWLLQGRSGSATLFQAREDSSVPEHSHGAQWGIVVEGEMRLTIDKATRTCRRGDEYFLPGGAPHPRAAEGPDTHPVAPAGRGPKPRRQRSRSLPPRGSAVLVLVLVPRHPDPFVPAVVDPARRADDRRVRRRSPRGFPDQSGHRGAHADFRDLHRQPGLCA